MVTKASRKKGRTPEPRVKAGRGESAGKRPKMKTSEFEEPLSKEDGTSFDATTAPRTAEDRAMDVSQDLQDHATTAPRRRPEETNTTSGTA